jgi:hypothetical protein
MCQACPVVGVTSFSPGLGRKRIDRQPQAMVQA